MNKKTTYLLGIAITIIVGTILYIIFCCPCKSCQNNADTVAPAVKDTVKAAPKKDSININPLTLHFGDDKAVAVLTPAQVKKMGDFMAYLKENPEAKISAIGYSDNTGSDEVNAKLSLERAEFAKQFLVKNGVNADKITTSAEGAKSPVADNATEVGRAQNRRVEIKIQ